MENQKTLTSLPNLVLINIFNCLDIQEYLNFLHSCKKVYELFNDTPLIFKRYVGMSEYSEEEHKYLQELSKSDVEHGYYDDPSNRRKELLRISKIKPEYLSILGYKTDGARLEYDHTYIKHVFVAFWHNCRLPFQTNEGKYLNVNLSGIMAPLKFHSFEEEARD